MNPIAMISACIAFISLILGIYILYMAPQRLLHKLSLLMMILISYWNFIAIVVNTTEDKETVIFSVKMASISLLVIPVILHLVMLIVKSNRKIMIPVLSICYLGFIFFIYRNFNLNLLYKDFIKIDGYWNFIKNDAGLIKVLYISSLLFIFLFAMILLINWYRKTNFIREKKQAKVLFSAMGLFILILTLDFVVYGQFSNRDYGISSLYIFIWPAGIGISVIKYGFLSFSPLLYVHDLFENIEEYVLVLDYNKKIILANSNAKKVISSDIENMDLMKFISRDVEITGNMDRLFKGSINNFTSNMIWINDDKSGLAIHARFSIVRDRYNDRIGVLFIGREMKGVREFSSEYKITGRELDVIRSITTGLSNRQAAERLNITEKTIETHMQHIYAKLDIKNKVELINILKKYDMA